MSRINATFNNVTALWPIAFLGLSENTDNIMYIYFGVPIILINILAIAVILNDKLLVRRSALMMGIIIGNLYLGLHLVCSGSYRYLLGYSAQLESATLASCASMIFPMFYSMAFNSEAIFLIMAGLERLLAIGVPNWFRMHWTDRVSWIVSGICHAVAWFMLLMGLFISTDTGSRNRSCITITFYGSKYVLFLIGFSAASGFLSTLLTMTALMFGLRRFRKLPLASGEAGRVRKQLQLAKSMASISCSELAFMAIPNMLSLLSLSYRLPTWIRSQNTTYTNAVNSLMIFIASVVFNHRFRHSAIRLLRAQKFAEFMVKMGFKSWGKPLSKATVHPMGNNVTVAPMGAALTQVASRSNIIGNH